MLGLSLELRFYCQYYSFLNTVFYFKKVIKLYFFKKLLNFMFFYYNISFNYNL